MKKGLRIQVLPQDWFGRPQYKPRLPVGDVGEWFLLNPSFLPLTEVPRSPPPETGVSPKEVRSAFEETYAAWDLPRRPATDRSLASLEDAQTAVVVAGQQPGFLGGPLFSVYKALSAISAARRYHALTGRPCVPVFWVASEDHDLEEVRETHMPGPQGSEVSFRFPQAADRRPLSDYTIGSEAIEVIEAAKGHLAHRVEGSRATQLADLYRGRNLASGFAALLSDLLGDTGLLVLDPASLRDFATPLFRKLVEDPRAITESIEEGREEVRRLGLSPQVAARFPLFILRDGQRHYLSPELRAGDGTMYSQSELLRLLDTNPRAFSSGALLRPLVQQSVLPCVLTIGGPAEVAYFAQLPPLAERLGVTPPAIGLRLSATLIDGKLARVAGTLSPHRISKARSPDDLLAPEDSEELRELSELADRTQEALFRAMEDLPEGGKVPRLQRKARQARETILHLREQIARERQNQNNAAAQGMFKLWNFMFPGGVLQERRWNILHFVARHGTDWLDDVIRHLERDPLRIAHRSITFGWDTSTEET